MEQSIGKYGVNYKHVIHNSYNLYLTKIIRNRRLRSTFNNNDNNLQLSLQGWNLQRVGHYKYLGVILQDDGRSNIHNEYLLGKLRKSAYNICRFIRPTTHPKVIYNLVKSILIPQLSYSLPFIQLTKHYIDKYESTILI